MRKFLMIASVVCIFVGATALYAVADTIPADAISFAGGTTPDNYNFTSATKFVSFNNVVVTSPAPTGAYAPIPVNTAASWNGFSWLTPFSAVKPLWAVSYQGVNYTFDASTVTILQQLANSIALQGTGTAHITGQADAAGTWVLTANSQGSTASFSASASRSGGTSVPEPSALILLGSGLVAAVGFGRKRVSG